MFTESALSTKERLTQEPRTAETQPGNSSKSRRASRIVFDLDDDDAVAFENITKAVGLKRRTEVLRYAIGLLETCAPYLKDGYEIKLQKEEAVVKVVVPRLSRRNST